MGTARPHPPEVPNRWTWWLRHFSSCPIGQQLQKGHKCISAQSEMCSVACCLCSNAAKHSGSHCREKCRGQGTKTTHRDRQLSLESTPPNHIWIKGLDSDCCSTAFAIGGFPQHRAVPQKKASSLLPTPSCPLLWAGNRNVDVQLCTCCWLPLEAEKQSAQEPQLTLLGSEGFQRWLSHSPYC